MIPLTDVPMDSETLALYIIAGVVSTIGFVMLYMEAKRNRLPEEPAPEPAPKDATGTEKKTGKKGRAKK